MYHTLHASPLSIDLRVVSDFYRATRRAWLARLISRILRRRSDLLAFDSFVRPLRSSLRRDLGLREVPVDQIVGSVGRHREFDRSFLPRDEQTFARWVRVDRAYHAGISLSPVELYKIGRVYFVEDGNHRISVARAQGQQFIEAHVVEIDSRDRFAPQTDLPDTGAAAG
jgi:hypothetical protein